MLVVVFSVLRPDTFTNAFNFANLIIQGAPVIVIAMGLVFVLLLGEIDLSAGFTAGVAGAVMGVAVTNHGWPWWLGVHRSASLTGAVIGLIIGLLVARLGIPSFVVTLACFLGLQGVLLADHRRGRHDRRSTTRRILAIMQQQPAGLARLGCCASCIVVGVRRPDVPPDRARRAQAGWSTERASVWALKVVALAVLLGIATAYLCQRAQPQPRRAPRSRACPIVVVAAAGPAGRTHLPAQPDRLRPPRLRRRRQRRGRPPRRHQRQAGIKTALLHHLLDARRGRRHPARQPGQLDLADHRRRRDAAVAVGAAVIGGTSLFGGKGRILDAVIGGLVIAVIANGMGLLNQLQAASSTSSPAWCC